MFHTQAHKNTTTAPGAQIVADGPFSRVARFDVTTFIQRYEAGDDEMTEDELVEGFQHLIDSGIAWQLQGAYGRTARTLIGAGLCRGNSVGSEARHG